MKTSFQAHTRVYTALFIAQVHCLSQAVFNLLKSSVSRAIAFAVSSLKAAVNEIDTGHRTPIRNRMCPYQGYGVCRSITTYRRMKDYGGDATRPQHVM